MKYKEVIIEWTDWIWKSLITSELKKLDINVQDRLKEFSSNIDLEKNDIEISDNIKKVLEENKEKLFIILYYKWEKQKKIIQKRLNSREKKDKFDKDFDEYNKIYFWLKEKIRHYNNVKFIDVSDNKTPYEILQIVLSEFFEDEINKIITNKNKKPTLEWESKKYFKLWDSKVALAELKPSIFSFTHSRYLNVEQTEVLRNKIWAILADIINLEYNHFKFNNENFTNRNLNCILADLMNNKSDIFLSNFIKKIDDKHSLVVFEDEIAENIEIVFKKYFVWTYAHKLLNPEKYKTLNWKILKKWYKLPRTHIRFDWRNPVFVDWKISKIPDWTIPDDFASEFINTENAKKLAHSITKMLEWIFDEIWIEVIDWCYFMNKEWTRIHSEITPDWLRLKLKENFQEDFDKDLWRKWLPKEYLVQKWEELYKKLKEKFNY